MKQKNLAVLSGAGISAESGIATFRGSNGLWEKYRIEEVATYDAWCKNPQLVLEFYNLRRKKAAEAQPNAAHYALKQLEDRYTVNIITQNVDDLHERAGSSNILHLHGKLREARSSLNYDLIYDIGSSPIELGDKCELGSQLRPNIVWFGEDVPLMDEAMALTQKADIFLVIGTSLLVYPAAGLLNYVKPNTPIYLIDPEPNNAMLEQFLHLTIIPKTAVLGMEYLLSII